MKIDPREWERIIGIFTAATGGSNFMKNTFVLQPWSEFNVDEPEKLNVFFMFSLIYELLPAVFQVFQHFPSWSRSNFHPESLSSAK
jgi:hypothetical protein